MKDVQNLHTIGTFPIEDQVVAVDPSAYATCATTIEVWVGFRPTTDIEARLFELFHKRICTRRVILGDPLGDPFERKKSRGRKFDFHAFDFAIFRYLAFRRANT